MWVAEPTPLQMIPLMCKWFHPCVHKSSTKWVAAWFSLCESYWSPWAHNIAQSELLQVLTLWKVVGPIGYTILHKVDSCSPHFVQVIGPHGISMQFTLRAQINNMKFIYFYYAHSGFPCELVHTLCMWFHPWNHNISQNGFKISNSCL
jgi:hypothetical protein